LTVDYIIIIIADVDLEVNPNEVRDTRYVSPEELTQMFKEPGTLFTYVTDDRLTIHAMVRFNLPEISL
jgi:isopentenyldiphosphate isomerase